MGPENLTLLTVKCTTIGKTKYLCRQRYKLNTLGLTSLIADNAVLKDF